jgi:hypothetical protein
VAAQSSETLHEEPCRVYASVPVGIREGYLCVVEHIRPNMTSFLEPFRDESYVHCDVEEKNCGSAELKDVVKFGERIVVAHGEEKVDDENASETEHASKHEQLDRKRIRPSGKICC